MTEFPGGGTKFESFANHKGAEGGYDILDYPDTKDHKTLYALARIIWLNKDEALEKGDDSARLEKYIEQAKADSDHTTSPLSWEHDEQTRGTNAEPPKFIAKQLLDYATLQSCGDEVAQLAKEPLVFERYYGRVDALLGLQTKESFQMLELLEKSEAALEMLANERISSSGRPST